MPTKQITSVVWSCGALPAGVSFNTATGTFSGTPEVEGEYIVPVTVTTNYGTDMKNVTLSVAEPEVEEDGEYGPVYAIGTKAKTWSGNAEADADGFRKLNMPDACRLVKLCTGFAAKTDSLQWYVCGTTIHGSSSAHPKPYGVTGLSPSVPVQFPVEDVVDMSSGWYRVTSSVSGSYYFAYLTSDHVSHVVLLMTANSAITSVGNIKKLSSGYGAGVMTIDNTGATRYENATVRGQLAVGVSPSQVKKLLATGMYSKPRMPTYITTSGYLYKGAERVDFGGGKIRNIWGYPHGEKQHLFAVTEDNQLYAMGENTYHSLGLDGTETRTELELVGEWDVKTIAQGSTMDTFLLTNDGKLYHSGAAMSVYDISKIVSTHESFTHIYPDKRFIDIAMYSSTTLVAILKE
ncbi:MAG: putative Ig domain-containing protein [Synergistaceae bacterium]|nr:putative Ig domain-containing protein [Synergistaceae bacterium]